jgi:hypothetical protein
VPDPFEVPMDPRVRAALETAHQRFGSRPNVIGIDYGIKLKGRGRKPYMAIRIHVPEKIPKGRLSRREKFPQYLLGVPVDVIEAVYEDNQAARLAAVDPINPGVSVGALGGGTGTLGLLVEDSTDSQPLLLGCAHIFGTTGPATIIQPGGADGGTAADAIGTWLRADRDTDSAVAVRQGARVFDPQILEAPGPITGLRFPQVGDVLEKSGRTTGITVGLVTAVVPSFVGLKSVITLMRPSPDQPLCDFGDSGSVWYDRDTGEAVALHCKSGAAQGKPNAYAIATILMHVVQRLNVRLPGGV